MTRELTKGRDHLAHNRRFIIGRSLAAAIAGALPVPLVEEWLASTIKRRTIKRIADSRAVDLSDQALQAIADGPTRPPEWTDVAGGGLLLRVLARSWRRVIVAAVAVRRAQAASRNFTIATLFDHYCARLHVGLGLDGADAAELRALMGQAIDQTPGGLSRKMFRRGLKAATRASLKAPIDLANLISGGAVKRLLKARDEVETVIEVDEQLEKQLASQDSFLARAAVAIELQLSMDNNPFLDDVIEKFETLVRERRQKEKNV